MTNLMVFSNLPKIQEFGTEYVNCFMVQASTYRLLDVETPVQSQTIPCGICDEESDTGTEFSRRKPWNSPASISLPIPVGEPVIG